MQVLTHSIRVGHTFLDLSTPPKKLPATLISFVISSSFPMASRVSLSCYSGITSQETAASLPGIIHMLGLKDSIQAVNFLPVI
jgi:hypothetical protein